MGKKEEPLPVVEGYVAEQKTISLVWGNVLAVLLIALAASVGFALMYVLWGGIHFNPMGMLLFSAGMLIGIVVHELVHGITWLVMLKKSFSHLSFGFMKGCAYCHIDVPMEKRSSVVGALMPLLLTGLLPWLAGIVANSWVWMMIGAVMIGGAAGDIMIVRALRHEASSTLVYDHPSDIGCYVYHKEQP